MEQSPPQPRSSGPAATPPSSPPQPRLILGTGSSHGSPALASPAGGAPGLAIPTPSRAGRSGSSSRRRRPKLSINTSVRSASPITQEGVWKEGGLSIGSEGVTDGFGCGVRYRLRDFKEIATLGSGRQAVVKQVRHTPTDTLYAMKVCKFPVGEDVRRKVLLELKTLKTSRHTAIVSLFDAFYRDGTVYMLLELMDCGSLEDVVRSVGRIPENVLAKIGRQLVNGLMYVHKDLHVIHRDIKPANLLINRAGDVKITDFGVSGQVVGTLGMAETFIGTSGYMSPERIKGKEHSVNSDVWSLGLTLMECAIGYFPYLPPGCTSDAATSYWSLMKVVCDDPVPELPEGFTPEFAACLRRCMEKDPTLRVSSVELFEDPWFERFASDDVNVAQWLRDTLGSMGVLQSTTPH